MKSRLIGAVAIFVISLLSTGPFARADELDQGRGMLSSGNLQGAAESFNRFASSHPDDSKKTPEALALCGRTLDALADSFTGAAEKRCYWGGSGGSPDCMQREVSSLNARFGADAFRYEHAVLYIFYTGSHYRQIAERFPKSEYAPEANFYLLLHSLVGHPDTVLPKIKAYLAKYPSGDWNRKGLLLWARVNQDVWYVHRKWSWVLFNNQISPDELIIRAEPYRQEALKTFERLMKERGTFEASAAEREHAALKANQEDAATYSIVNDSSPGVLSSWGVAAPAPPALPPDRGAGHGTSPADRAKYGTTPQPPANTPTFEPAPAAPEPKEKPKPSSGVPKRWQ